MTGENIKQRTKNLAVNIAQTVLLLPVNTVNKVYLSQIIRSSSAIAANYRAAAREKSDRDFINKLKICEEESDETMFWIEMLSAFNSNFDTMFAPLYKECNELVSIFVASLKTVRKRVELAASKKINN